MPTTQKSIQSENKSISGEPASAESRAKLKEKLKTLPAQPGVYFHKSESGEIIYVGKAAVLKNRVRQYFQNSKNKDLKTQALVKEIADTDWIVVDTEMDALFLESEMIKRYMPRWNILLRDDKTVSYIRIDMESEVPYVTMTRTPQDDKAKYIGPFYGKQAVQKALRILRKVFPYYDKPYTGKKSLNTDLGLTPGIEINKTTPKEYKQNLRKLIRYLEGDRQKLVKEVEKQMQQAAKDENYEKAAELRNQFFGLRELKKKIVFSDKEFLDISSDQALAQLQQLLKLKNPPRRIEGYDISHQSGTNVVASMVVFVNGVSDRAEYRKFKLRKQQNDDPASLREVLERRLKHQEWDYPDLIILDGGVPQLNAVKDLLADYHIPVIGRDKSGDHGRNAEVKLVVSTDIPLETVPREGYDPSETSEPRDARPLGRELPKANGREREWLTKEYQLTPSSHIARLIARIDEEAHRFAITYHSLLKRKNMLK